MSKFTKGKLVDTGGLKKNSYGNTEKVYAVEENKFTFQNAPAYYKYMMDIWRKHVAKGPNTNPCALPIFDKVDLSNLDAICRGSYFFVEDDTIHIDNWNVNEDCLYHKHTEFGAQCSIVDDTSGEIEWSVYNRACTLCGEEIPDNIWLIHRMYQL